jgi:hypothetical protein
MRRFFILFAIISVFLSSCSKKTPEDAAGKAAEEYYNYLIEGKYDQYVAAMDNSEGVPEGYRQQLITMAKQFVAQQKEERGGLKSAKRVNSVIDSATHTKADAFLEVCYGDSTSEEVVVPMVLKDGKWKMK